jgi:hypothetical protein
MEQENFSPVADFVKKAINSKLDRWKPIIEGWLDEDRKMRFKQRHTAKRVHQRLLKEYEGEYDCSYPLVQRFLKDKRMKKGGPGFHDLIWQFGNAQADFGEADILLGGLLHTIKFLVLSFPASNAAFVQVFGGETAECVVQGLIDIFVYIGGVPILIVFDNASGVGRRIRDRVVFSELFLRFKCHYGFSVRFCNPDSGHEKGNVENKVGYIRRNLFVPVPVVEDIITWNRELLHTIQTDFDRPHYRKGISIAELFKEDQTVLGILPETPFRAERIERIKTDGYGKFCLDGKHWYSSAPEYGGQDVIVNIGAHHITVRDENGLVIVEHARSYGEGRTETNDYMTSLDLLIAKPGAWHNSGLRAAFTSGTRNLLDQMSKKERSRILGTMSKSAQLYGSKMALLAAEKAIAHGLIDDYSLQITAARLSYGEKNETQSLSPDLSVYDKSLLDNSEEVQ